MVPPRPWWRSPALWVVLLFAFGVRLGVSLAYRSRLSPGSSTSTPQSEATYLKTAHFELGDSREYLLAAENLRQSGRFSWDGRTALTFRTPGYPLLLAVLGDNLALVLLVQSLLGAFAVLLVFAIGRRLAEERTGIVAASLLALDLPSIDHTGTVMSETWFVAILLFGAWLFFHATGNPERRPGAGGWPLAGSGVALGFAALVRPIALLGFIPFAVALAAQRRWRGLLLFLLCVGLLPGAWLARNYAHYRRVGFTSISGYNHLYYNAAMLVGSQRGVTMEQARWALRDSLASELVSDNPLVLSEQMTRIGTGIILADPARYAGVCLHGLSHSLFGVKSDEIVLRIVDPEMRFASVRSALARGGATSAGVAVLAVLELLTVAAASVAALVSLSRRRDPVVVLLLLVAAYYLVMAMPVPDGRFRIPAMPFVYLAAGLLFSRRARPGA